jgi:iron complex outermembrane recepter protein
MNQQANGGNMNLFSKSAAHTISFTMLCLACTALTPVQTQAQNAAPVDAESDEVVLDEIVVTATRRDLKLSDVPLSISALPQDTLTTRGIRDSADIAYVAPGLSVISDNSGGENLSVRGIVAIGSTATTAFYTDETPISQVSGGTFSPRYFDVERVEVLRGPQGTLFGASAMGGVIRIITKRPNTYRFEGTVRAEGSTTRLGSQNYVVDGAVNVPIISDVLALRMTGFYEKQAGWVKSFTPIFSDDPADYVDLGDDGLRDNGITDPADPDFDPLNRNDDRTGAAYQGFTGSGKRVGDQTVYGGRAALLFQPTDTLKLTATYHWQQRKNDGFNNADRSVGLGLPGSDFRQARSFAEFRNLRSQLANLTGEFDVGFAKLTSSTSYEWNRESVQQDATALGFGGIAAGFGIVPRDTSGQAGVGLIESQKKSNFTQEIRLVSNSDGAFNWILGGFYNRAKYTKSQNYPTRGLAAVAGDELAPGDSFGSFILDESVREISFFGEVGYKFSDKFSATVGLRRYSVKPGTGSIFSGLLAGGDTTVNDPVSFTENGFTYKAVLNYKPNDDLLLFAGYTTGYRPGGANLPALGPDDVIPSGFTSDKLTQYELGWKSSWLDRALTVNGAVFYIDWSDIPTGVTAPSGQTYSINGPQARNYGAELELVIRPTKGFDVSFGLTVLNAKFSRDFVDVAGAGLQISKGDRLPNVPDITLNAALNYQWSIGDANARIGANVVHVTKRTQTANEVVSPLPGFVNAGLSAGVDLGKFDVSLFVRNLFDTRALIGNSRVGSEVVGGVFGPINYQSYLQPRTIGASVQVKF